MREIKFRCWYNNQMYKVKSIDFNNKLINLNGADIIDFEEGILMQYIGLKDKNGVEIYENDKVKFVRNFSKYKCSKSYEFEVYFNTFLCHYALHILDDDSNSYGKNGQFDILTLTGAKVKDLEVIGNIYDKEVE